MIERASERANGRRRVSRRIAGAPRVVQRVLRLGFANVSSPSLPLSLSSSLLSCAPYCRVLVALSLRGYQPASPLSTGVYNCRPELSKRCVRARVWWKEVSEKLSTWGIGESPRSKSARVRG